MDGTGKVNPAMGTEHLKVHNTLYDRRGHLNSMDRKVDLEAVDAAAYLLQALAGAFKRELEFDTRSGEVIFTEEGKEIARLSGLEAVELVEKVYGELTPLLERRA